MNSIKPMGVIVFGIIGIIISLMIALGVFSIARFAISSGANVPFYVLALFFICVALGFVVSGIGLLGLKRWSRNIFLLSMAGYVCVGLAGVFSFRILDFSEITKGNFPQAIISFLLFFIVPAGAAFLFFTKDEIKSLFK